MAANRTWGFFFMVKLLSLCLIFRLTGSQSPSAYWNAAHATFYGDMNGTGTMSKFQAIFFLPIIYVCMYVF